VRPQGLPTLIIHAPGIHNGGGLVLLNSLLLVAELSIHWLQMDQRLQEHFQLPSVTKKYYIKRSIFSRILAEWHLRLRTQKNDIVLCFHGLPPLFSLRGRVVVFLQNRILVNQKRIGGYLLRTKVRLMLERWLLSTFSHHVDKFIVQTPSMAQDVKKILGSDIDIVVLPFSDSMNFESYALPKQFDFIYVAGDEAHKNHKTLIETWRLLSDVGMMPSLALTLPVDSTLAREIEIYKTKHKLNISNLGTLKFSEISCVYRSSSALIYPSTTESLGLPLIEASQHGLPILAPEMDYVRDVVQPVQTFDPYSSVSIARAVMRFLGQPEPILTMKTPADFLAEVLK